YYNSAGLVLDSAFWLNRALTVAMPAALLLALVRTSRGFTVESSVTRRPFMARWRRAASKAVAAPGAPLVGTLASMAMRTSVPTVARGSFTVMMTEVRLLRRQPALWLFTAVLMFIVVE